MSSRVGRRAVLIVWTVLVGASLVADAALADARRELLAAFDQGDDLYNKGEYAAAAKAYERALALAPQVFGAEHEDTAAVMNNLANAYKGMAEFNRAESLLQRSLKIQESRRGGDDLDVARGLFNLGGLYCETNQFAKAEPLLRRSLKIRESQLGPDDVSVAESLQFLGSVYYETGQYSKAEPLCQRSLKIKESKLGPSHPSVANTVNLLATIYATTGEHAQAEPLFRKSLAIMEAKRGSDSLGVANMLNNLAELYRNMGQSARAIPLFQRSIAIKEAKLGPDHPEVAVGLSNLGAVFSDLGQHARAVPLYLRSIKIAESKLGPDHPSLAVYIHNLGNAYRNMKQYEQAEPLYQRSLQIRESRLGPNHPEVAKILQALAVLYRNMHQYAKVESLYQRSLKIREASFGPDHPDVAFSLTGLGNVHKYTGRYAQAEPFYQRALTITEARLGPDHPYLATRLHNLARLHAFLERWPEAVAETDRERRIVRRYVARTLPVLSEKEQLTFLASEDEAHLHAALSLALHRATDAEAARLSAGWVLNGKAVAQEVLAQRTVLGTRATAPTTAQLTQQLLSARTRLATLSLAMPTPGRETTRREELATLQQQEQELSRRLGQATGQDATADPWVELAAVRQALPNEAMLVEFVRFDVWDMKDDNSFAPHYVAWLIPAAGEEQISIVDLGGAQAIDDAIRVVRKNLEAASKTIREQGEAEAEKRFRESMRGVGRLVFEPLEKHFGAARQLVVSPDAGLWLVPWAAFPLADGKYAIEKYQMRCCISGRELASPASIQSRKLSASALFANPDFDLGPAEAGAATRAVLRTATSPDQVATSRGLGSLNSLPRVKRLPGTAVEARAIQPGLRRFAGTEPVLYEDEYALEGVFKALHRPRVLVLSTHGFFLPDQEVAADRRDAGSAEGGGTSRAVLTAAGQPLENPLLRCGLLLAGCNQRAQEESRTAVDDGVLTGLEIVGTDLRGTELVVLSACETGLGEVRNGEGVAGLRQAFQLAGAKSVVSTLWQIPDRETAVLVSGFFAYLSAGQGKAEALRNAQLAQIQARREAHSAAHPHYWAAFTVTGGE